MSRQLRIEFEGAHYHVMSRGNARQAVFLDASDHHTYLDLLGETCVRFDWHCHAFCLMPNHVHLLIETRAANLSRGMRHLNGVFTQRYNKRHARVGHLFQGRYKALLVDHDAYLLALVRYILLNPVRARLVRLASEWRWSSYDWAVARRMAPAWAAPFVMWRSLGADAGSARNRIEALLAMKAGDDELDWEAAGVLGSDAFKASLTTRLMRSRRQREVPTTSRFADRPSLHALFDDAPRDAAVHDAVERWGYTQACVSAHLGVSKSLISKILRDRR